MFKNISDHQASEQDKTMQVRKTRESNLSYSNKLRTRKVSKMSGLQVEK